MHGDAGGLRSNAWDDMLADHGMVMVHRGLIKQMGLSQRSTTLSENRAACTLQSCPWCAEESRVGTEGDHG